VHGPTPEVGEVVAGAVVAVVGVGGLVVVVVVAVVTGDVDFGFVVATEEPHPRTTIPATRITVAPANCFTMGMCHSTT